MIAYIPANGRRLWTDTLTSTGRYTPLSAINDIAGKPTIQDGVVYASSHSGVLVAIDARSGTRIWSKAFGSRQGPVIGGDFLYVVGVNSVVAAINKIDGKVAWDLRNSPNSAMATRRTASSGCSLLASDRVVVASSEGDVIALSSKNGETISDIKLGQAVYISSIAASGKIFVLTDQAQLVAIK